MKLRRLIMLLIASSSYHMAQGCALCVGKVDLTAPPFFYDEQERELSTKDTGLQASVGHVQSEECEEEV